MSDTRPRHGWFRRFIFFLKFLEIRLRFVMVLVITALLVGYWDTIQNYIERWQRQRSATTASVAQADHAHEGETEFYCPMHTFVVRDHPGKCPICGMDLVPRKKGEAVALPPGTLARVQVSPDRIMEAGVRVEPVSYRLLSYDIRSYGTIEPDETKMAQIIARFPGRVDQLFANAAGMTVNKGDALAQIYSPKYLAAAQEYVQALATQKRLQNDNTLGADAGRRAGQLSEYARQRLALAGFTQEQLDQIARTGQAEERVTLVSPLSGTVLEKNVLLGDAVEEGTKLYTIADLSTLWVQALIAEGDLGQIKQGMAVEVTTVSQPDLIFFGKVDFIYPTINAENRSGKVRIVVDNRNGALKPGMYVNALVHAPVGKIEEIGGETTASAPASSSAPASAPASKPGAQVKLPTTTPEAAQAYLSSLPAGSEYYQCPMDLEVISDKQEDCPKCGMHLEKRKKEATETSKPAAEKKDAGWQPAPQSNEVLDMTAPSTQEWAEGWACPMHVPELVDHPGICPLDGCGMPMKHWRIQRVLSVPEAAVIDTGTRYVVYVDAQPGVYDSREVKLGRRSGAFYPVDSGLNLGDRIVAAGAFLIDAEARLNPTTVAK